MCIWMQVSMESREGCQIPYSLSYSLLWAWVLGTKLRSSPQEQQELLTDELSPQLRRSSHSDLECQINASQWHNLFNRCYFCLLPSCCRTLPQYFIFYCHVVCHSPNSLLLWNTSLIHTSWKHYILHKHHLHSVNNASLYLHLCPLILPFIYTSIHLPFKVYCRQ